MDSIKIEVNNTNRTEKAEQQRLKAYAAIESACQAKG